MGNNNNKLDLPNNICRCVCGNEMLIAEKLEKYSPDEESEYAIAFTSSYLGSKRGRLRGIWNILRGKEPWYAEVIIPESDLRKFLVGCVTLMHK